MAFTIAQFCHIRPFLYHLTYRENLARIRRTGELKSAARVLESVGVRASEPRRQRLAVSLGSDRIYLRDQTPLHAGNIEFEDGWDFRQLVRHLNAHVFFWAGIPAGPIDYGRRHYTKYRAEHPIWLRVPAASLFAANSTYPLFCRYNSGSPRCVKGRKSPRGSRTFVEAAKADFAPAAVVEVVFRDAVVLPDDVEYLNPAGGDA